jgi:hypothetical protein
VFRRAGGGVDPARVDRSEPQLHARDVQHEGGELGDGQVRAGRPVPRLKVGDQRLGCFVHVGGGTLALHDRHKDRVSGELERQTA